MDFANWLSCRLLFLSPLSISLPFFLFNECQGAEFAHTTNTKYKDMIHESLQTFLSNVTKEWFISNGRELAYRWDSDRITISCANAHWIKLFFAKATLLVNILQTLFGRTKWSANILTCVTGQLGHFRKTIYTSLGLWKA